MNLTSLVRVSLLAALLPLIAAVPSNAADPVISNGTEAVFYAHGVISAQTEIFSSIVTSVTPYLPFRQMAGQNRMLADLFRFAGVLPAALFFEGRASAFEQIADLLGEPPSFP